MEEFCVAFHRGEASARGSILELVHDGMLESDSVRLVDSLGAPITT